MSMSETISKSTVIFFLGTLLTGFLAGIGTSEKIQEWRGITQAAQDKLQCKIDDLVKEKKALESQIKSLEGSINNLKGEKLELKLQMITQAKNIKDQLIQASTTNLSGTVIEEGISIFTIAVYIVIALLVIIIGIFLFAG